MADLSENALEIRAMLDAMCDMGTYQFHDMLAVERAYEVTFE